MKRLLNKITDMLADAALLEMGVDVQTTAEHRSKVASEPRMSLLKRFFKNITDTLADAALLEMGVNVVAPVAKAEAADYDDIHKTISREHRPERDIAHPDECQYGDNDMCFDRRAA